MEQVVLVGLVAQAERVELVVLVEAQAQREQREKPLNSLEQVVPRLHYH
jgi:hypothetical protein